MVDVYNVSVLRDQRPGHYNQSEGIIKALGRKHRLNVEYADIRLPAFRAWRFLYSLHNKGLISDTQVLKWLYPNVRLQNKPDLIVSAGGETLLLNAALARIHQCQNIFSGSLRNIDPELFTAVLIPYERFADIEPYVCCLKPCAVDPDEVPDVPDPVDVCFLIGGPSGTHSYTANHWTKIIELADAAARRFRTGVFTSRRTPAQVFGEFKQQENGNLSVFGSDEISSGGVMDFCKKARMVLVTEDSNSMITEAVCCRKPVCVLGPASNGMNANEAAYLEGLEARNWLYSQSLDADFSFETLCEKIEDLSPMQENHLDVLAGKLQKKLNLASI